MQNTVKSIINEIIATLKQHDLNGDYLFINEFKPSNKPSPVLKPTAVFGTQQIEFTEGSFGEYLGTDAMGNTVTGRKCNIIVNIRLYLPREYEGDISSFFETIASFLAASHLSSGIVSIKINNLSSNNMTDCFTASGEIKLNALFNTVSGKDKFAASFTLKPDI